MDKGRSGKFVFRALFITGSLLTFFMVPPCSYAAENRGVDFRETVKVGADVLQINGVGLLKWNYLVKVYLVGLYMPRDTNINNVLADIPKRLEYYFFLDMKAADFQSTGLQLMSRNVGEAKANELLPELDAFNNLYRDVKSGQRYTITYIPGKGTELALDGKSLGWVPGADFAAAYFAIWLGPDPVSKSLRDGLLEPATMR